MLCPWGFSREEYWSGLPCPPPGDLPNSGIEPSSPCIAGRFFTVCATREAPILIRCFCLSEQHQHLFSCINQKPRSHSWDFLLPDPLSLQNPICHSTLRICTFLYLPSPLTTLVSATSVCSLTRAPKGAPCILSFYQPVPHQSGFHSAILIGVLPLRPTPSGFLSFFCPLPWPAQSCMAWPPKSPQVQHAYAFSTCLPHDPFSCSQAPFSSS